MSENQKDQQGQKTPTSQTQNVGNQSKVENPTAKNKTADMKENKSKTPTDQKRQSDNKDSQGKNQGENC